MARLIFTLELLVAAVLVSGTWKFIFHGRLDELWGGAMFCFSVILAIILNALLSRALFKRKPLFGPVAAVIIAVVCLAAGIGLCWTQTH